MTVHECFGLGIARVKALGALKKERKKEESSRIATVQLLYCGNGNLFSTGTPTHTRNGVPRQSQSARISVRCQRILHHTLTKFTTSTALSSQDEKLNLSCI